MVGNLRIEKKKIRKKILVKKFQEKDTTSFGQTPFGQMSFSRHIMECQLVKMSEPLMLLSTEDLGTKLGEGM
jgi:hypothetical protein